MHYTDRQYIIMDSRTGIIVIPYDVQQVASLRTSHLFLGRQGLLVYSDTAVVTHTRLTTITCMRTFCSILPVGSRSRLRSYTASIDRCRASARRRMIRKINLVQRVPRFSKSASHCESANYYSMGLLYRDKITI